MVNRLERIGSWVLLAGSMKVAKPRPICRPMTSPATSRAVKISRTTKPIATPMRNCCATSTQPCGPDNWTSGGGGSVGTSTMVSTRPVAMRMPTGIRALPSSGSAASRPSTRTSGSP